MHAMRTRGIGAQRWARADDGVRRAVRGFCRGPCLLGHARASQVRAWPCSKSAGEAGAAFSRLAAARAPRTGAPPPAAGAHSRGRNVHSAARRSSASAAAAARPARAGASDASSASGRGACTQAGALRMQRMRALACARLAGARGPPEPRAFLP